MSFTLFDQYLLSLFGYVPLLFSRDLPHDSPASILNDGHHVASAGDSFLAKADPSEKSLILPQCSAFLNATQTPGFTTLAQIPSSILAVLSAPDTLYDPNVAGSKKLVVEIGGRGSLNWNRLRPSVERVIRNVTPDTLTINWHSSEVDKDGTAGRLVLKSLFRRLNQEPKSGGLRPISYLKRLSIAVPAHVRDRTSFDLLGRATWLDDSVQLQHADVLEEFSWEGDFVLFGTKFQGLQALQLRFLHVSGCIMSVNDALALLHDSPRLVTVTLSTIHDAVETELGDLLTPPELKILLPELTELNLVSKADLRNVLPSVKWTQPITLNIELCGEITPLSVQSIQNALPVKHLAFKIKSDDIWTETLKKAFPLGNMTTF